jgi:hypothetical protein
MLGLLSADNHWLLIRLLQAAVIPEADRRTVNSDFPYSSTDSCWMARMYPGHIIGRFHRLEVSNSPIGSIIATGQRSDRSRTRQMIYHAHNFTSTVVCPLHLVPRVVI